MENELTEFIIQLIVILNLVLALMVFIEDIYFYIKVKESSGWSKLLYAGVGFFWSVRYVSFFIQGNPFELNQYNFLLLLLVTYTLLALTVGANIRVQRDIGTEEIKKDVIKIRCKTVDKVKRILPWTSKQ